MSRIAGSLERNGAGAPLGRMAPEMLELIRQFTEKMREEGRDVYLGESGVPFTAEGGGNGLEHMRVDLHAIQVELQKRGLAQESTGG